MKIVPGILYQQGRYAGSLFTGYCLSSVLQLYSVNLINPLKKSEGVSKKLCGLLAFTLVQNKYANVEIAYQYNSVGIL